MDLHDFVMECRFCDIHDEKKAAERERYNLPAFADPNKYGYQLNVNNNKINKFYWTYMSRNKIYPPMSDKRRIEWERELWEYFRKIYRSLYKINLPEYCDTLYTDVVGWELTRLEDIINRLNVDKAINQLYGK